jgi:3-ketosteroid 9alpha-monooxygenase subunit B
MQANLTLRIGGQTSMLPVQHGQTLLDAAEDAGIDLPNACRQGTCGACIATLIAGEVRMDHAPVLSKRDRAAGLILACQAVPATPELTISYDE